MLGELIGNHRVTREIGSGSMGEVFLAEHEQIHTCIAIKVLYSQISKDRDQVERFFNEARAAERIQHAGIVKIHDVGFAANGRAYLCMELLDGESLASRLALGPMTHRVVCETARQIASALAASHDAGIIHRDLKPDNIFLARDQSLPGGERVKVLDFGIAKLTGLLSPQRATRGKSTMGTPRYMAPEQADDASAVDARADIYSLGCIVFEMACGRPPFEAKSDKEAYQQHAEVPPPSGRSIIRDLSPALDALIARMLAKAPGDRPRTMHELVAAFAALASDTGDRRRGPRWPWALAATGAVGAAVAAAALMRGGCGATPVALDGGQPTDAAADATADAIDSTAPRELRERVEAANPFVEVAGATFVAQRRQVSRAELGWFLAGLDPQRAAALRPLRDWDPTVTPTSAVVWVAFEQADAFCQAIGGELPTDDEWKALARDAKGTRELGPQREWTRTRGDDDNLVLIRRPRLAELPVQKSIDPRDGDTERAGDNLGFRCVRAIR